LQKCDLIFYTCASALILVNPFIKERFVLCQKLHNSTDLGKINCKTSNINIYSRVLRIIVVVK